MTHDILIKGGQVVDGTGSEAKYADIFDSIEQKLNELQPLSTGVNTNN